MVNAPSTIDPQRSGRVVAEPERVMALTYAPSQAAARGIAALLMLDDRLAETVRTTSEPILGQMRLKWWEDSLIALDRGPPPGEPVLAAITRDVLPHGVTGAALAEIPRAWETVLGEVLDAVNLERFGARGRAIYAASGRICGADGGDPVASGGEGWALSDLAGGLSDPDEAAAARALARAALDVALAVKWSRNGRALGAMAHLARMDLDGVPKGSPKRVARALWHRITGR